MPRSTDPRNYGPFYDKLAELMDRGQQEIKLTMSGRLAIYHRNNFYAFINAWKHKAKSIPGDKAISSEAKPRLLEQAIRTEDILRRYLIVIDPEPNAELEHVELRFILRGMDERQREGIEQLNALIAKATERGELSSAEILERIQGTPEMRAVDTAAMRGKESPVAHLFGGVVIEPDPDMTDAEADAILHGLPPDRTDLTDLVTPSNQAGEKPLNLMEEALKSSEKLRQKERE